MHARRVVSAVAFILACAGALPALRAQAVPAGSGIAAPEDPLLLLAPTRFTRSRGRVDTFERSFTVPPWIVAPYTMRVQNGEPDGSNRLVLGWIWVNGQRVAAPSDFSRNRNRRFDNESERSSFNDQDDDDNEDGQGSSRRGQPVSDGALTGTLALRAQNTLRVRLAGRRDRYITVSIRGTSGDHTAPTLTFVEPAVSITNSAEVRVRLRYTDPVGSGERAASGVVLSTLRVTVDGTDRTSSFAASTTEALASLNLGEGPHVLQAQVRDRAGNASTASSTFTVDTVPPSVAIVSPAADDELVANLPFSVQSEVNDLTAVSVTIDGVPANLVGNTWSGSIDAAPDGTHTVTVVATDSAGNQTTQTRGFVLDTTAPVVTILEPVSDTSTISTDATVTGTVDDLTLQSVAVNGVLALLQDVATGSSRTFTAMVPLTMGANQIVVVGTDATGRTGVAEVSLTRVPPCQVTVSPSSVTAPAEGATGVLIVSNLTTCFWTASTNTAWITISGTADGYAGQVMADGPAGYWRLDELDTIARDSSGHGHDGTLIQPHTRGVAGASADGNAATRFDGGSVQFQDGGFPLLDGAFSVEAWLRYDETGSGTVAIGNMWRLSLEAGRVSFFAGFSENTFADVRTVTPINDDLWHHVVATFDPGQATASLFVDGVLDASSAIDGEITGNAFWMIGWLTAAVDDVAVYPSALSPAQVARHFELRNSLGGGSGSITYTVPPNPSIVPRTGVVTVAGLDVPFAQAGLHCFSVTPPAISVGAAGGTGTIHVSALDPGCAWVIAPTVPWVSLDVTSGTGAGDVQYTVAQNATPLERTATLTIAGRAVTVGQSGVPIQRPGFRFSVAAGAQHSLALTDAGIVWRWGANGSGQLGDGTITTRLTPVLVSTFTNVVAIAAGAAHSLALRGDGIVWAWGANSRGQLGDGSTTNRTAPVKSNNGLNNVVAIAAGSEHSVALKADGAVWVWGRNNVGQLGDGTLTNKVSPKLVAGLPSPAIAIAASGTRTLVVDVHGLLWAFGAGATVPVHVASVTPVVQAAAAAFGWFAVTPEGGVWAWGSNDRSQLGDGTTITPVDPLQLSAIEPVLQIGTGASHAIALVNDSTVLAWGGNEAGQLGNGTTPCPTGNIACVASQYSATRIAVSGLFNVAAVSANGQHNLAVTRGGQVWAWGADGTAATRTTPQVVLTVPPTIP